VIIMRSARPQEQTNNRVARKYSAWATGDGARIEFPLPKNVTRPEDLWVTVGGLYQRPADGTGVFDYDVRGFRPTYPGDHNMVKFTVAPAAGVHVGFHLNAD
jgi:hypothetical protein